jgi:hypothetical protein
MSRLTVCEQAFAQLCAVCSPGDGILSVMGMLQQQSELEINYQSLLRIASITSQRYAISDGDGSLPQYTCRSARQSRKSTARSSLRLNPPRASFLPARKSFLVSDHNSLYCSALGGVYASKLPANLLIWSQEAPGEGMSDTVSSSLRICFHKATPFSVLEGLGSMLRGPPTRKNRSRFGFNVHSAGQYSLGLLQQSTFPQLTKPGVCTTLRFSFARSWHFE